MSVQPLHQTQSSQQEPSCGIGLSGLTLEPFENTRDGRFWFPANSHEQALTKMLGLCADGNQGFGLLSGEPGLGKTLVRTMLHRSLDSSRFVRVSIETCLLDFDGILLEILSQMRGERFHGTDLPDRYSRLGMFKSLLSERVVHPGRHLVILTDEAQGLELPVLDGLRNLSNVSSEQRNLMSVILVGGSSLGDRVRSMPDLSQRVSVSCRLSPLDEPETRAYVNHRLRTAGSPFDLALDDSTWTGLHTASGGNPREINRVMKRTMAHAGSAGMELDQASLASVLAEHGDPRPVALDEFA